MDEQACILCCFNFWNTGLSLSSSQAGLREIHSVQQFGTHCKVVNNTFSLLYTFALVFTKGFWQRPVDLKLEVLIVDIL